MSEGATVQMNTDPQVIDMALGHPSPALLPLEAMQRAAEHRFGQGDPLILQYGFEQGDAGFRTELAELLKERSGADVKADSLMVTGGISQALALLCSLYTRPGDEVLVEDPTYFLALRIFEDFGLKVTVMSGDEKGLDPDALEQYLHSKSGGGRSAAGPAGAAPVHWPVEAAQRPRFLYTIPVFQNPTGRTIPPERRRRLIEVAEKYGLLVVADEAYQLLSYREAPPSSFASTTSASDSLAYSVTSAAAGGSAQVISLGSFSKILGPGLRLGWLQAGEEHLKKISGCGMLDSGGGLNPFTSTIVRSMFQSGDMARHLDRLIGEYRQRMDAVVESIGAELAGLAEVENPGGGYFVWVKLPKDIDARELKKRARRNNVNFLPGSSASPGGSFHNYLRLSVSYNDAERLQSGVKRLAGVLREAGSTE
jgi:2-aminoadipate transaminase